MSGSSPNRSRERPTTAWITLAGLARETSTIRLGTLVTAATFRLPGPLAIAVAQVDQMSAGRVEFGFGAGWYEQEHTAYGIPFPPLGDRFDNVEEQMAIIHGLWNASPDTTFSFEGRRWHVSGSPALPKPVQAGGPPVIVGGRGAVRTPRLAARYAAEFNLPFPQLDDVAPQCEVVRRACEVEGRDPSTMVWSVALVVCVGDDEATFARRAAAIGREPDVVDEAAVTLRRWQEVGADRIYLQVLDLADLDHLDLVAAAADVA